MPLPSHPPRPEQFGPKVLVSRAKQPRAGPGRVPQRSEPTFRERAPEQRMGPGCERLLPALEQTGKQAEDHGSRKKRKLTNEKRRYIITMTF